MAKILKNQLGTTLTITDTGVTLPASPGTYTIPEQDYLLWGASSNIVTQVGNGNVKVNDGSFDLSISDGTDHLKGFFPKDIKIRGNSDSTLIGNVSDSLKVTMVSGNGSFNGIQTISKKLRYVDMNAGNGGVARGTVLTTAETNVFLYNGTGIVFWFLLNVKSAKDDWLFKFYVDNETIFDTTGLLSNDLKDNGVYDLDHNHDEEAALLGLRFGKREKLIWMGPGGYGIAYNSSVRITVARISGKPNKAFTGGLVALTKET